MDLNPIFSFLSYYTFFYYHILFSRYISPYLWSFSPSDWYALSFSFYLPVKILFISQINLTYHQRVDSKLISQISGYPPNGSHQQRVRSPQSMRFLLLSTPQGSPSPQLSLPFLTTLGLRNSNHFELGSQIWLGKIWTLRQEAQLGNTETNSQTPIQLFQQI